MMIEVSKIYLTSLLDYYAVALSTLLAYTFHAVSNPHEAPYTY